MSDSSANKRELLTDLLRSVSRSFYQTLKVLPKPVRPQIGLAYLLARIADSLADTPALPAPERLAALDLYAACVAGEADGESLRKVTAEVRGDSHEDQAVRRAVEAITVLNSFEPEDQQLIRAVLKTIISGQRLDVERFGAASGESIVAIESLDQLRDYTYRVAGSVGEFWTHICRKRLFPAAFIPMDDFVTKGVEFGHGLQLTNVLRDLSADLRTGRCYLPRHELAKLSLSPGDLLNAGNFARVRGLYDYLLRKAEEGLKSGWAYTQMIPASQVRCRLACAWPALIGLRTLRALSHVNPLKPDQRVKISRKEVRSILARTVLLYPAPFLWRRLG